MARFPGGLSGACRSWFQRFLGGRRLNLGNGRDREGCEASELECNDKGALSGHTRVYVVSTKQDCIVGCPCSRRTYVTPASRTGLAGFMYIIRFSQSSSWIAMLSSSSSIELLLSWSCSSCDVFFLSTLACFVVTNVFFSQSFFFVVSFRLK